MNTVAGRVVVKETNEALGGLVVVAYDVEGDTSPAPDGASGLARRDRTEGGGERHRAIYGGVRAAREQSYRSRVLSLTRVAIEPFHEP